MRRLIGFTAAVALFALCSVNSPVSAETVSSEWDPFCGAPRIGFSGEEGVDYQIQASESLEADPSWVSLWQFTGSATTTSWCDTEARTRSRRFYRALRLDAPPPQIRTRNFRLTDQSGRSHELYYSFNDSSVVGYVLVFAGKDLSSLQPTLETWKTLSQTYTNQGIQFWGIAAEFGNNRSNLIHEVSTLGIPFPVLHDRAEVITREFGIERTPEVVVVRNGTFDVVYRGAVEEQNGNATDHYLASALDSLLQGQPANPYRVRVVGTETGLQSIATPDYATEIAPILQRRCVQCHSPGNIAPWAMTNHAIVAGYADLMKDEIFAMRMPPWHADPHVGAFANDSSLRPDEASLLCRWISLGSPRGTGADPLEQVPPPPADWPLGKPDLVLSIPVQSLPALGDVAYRYITVDPKLTQDVWLKAAVVKPGNRKSVHHALVFLGTAEASLGGLGGYFAGYVPGLDPSLFPDGTAKSLPKGTKLTFQMHYISVGTPQQDQTQLGLYFAASAPKQKFQTKAAFDVSFAIPPGNPEYPTTSRALFTKNAVLYEISPHQHLRGKWFRYTLQLPDGTQKPIINIPRYQFSWQRLYRLAEPLVIPAGSSILCTGAWDNSPQNLDNPNSNVPVFFGEQTYEEMFIGYYNYGESL